MFTVGVGLLPKTLKIAGFEVEPGKRKLKMVKVGELTDNCDACVPFIVVNGIKDGPTLVLRGGEHGSEYCGQEQVRLASLKVDPEKLSGAIIAVPNCSPLAYQSGTYKNLRVYDMTMGENIDYPGNPEGGFDQRVANLIWEEAISKADFTLTMHDGGTHWIARYLHVSYTSDTKELGERMLEIAKAFGVGLPIRYAEVPDYHRFERELANRGVPFFMPECGGMRMLWQNDIERGLKGIMNVMKHLNMIDGKPEPSRQIIFNAGPFIRCNHGGVLRPAFSPLDIPVTVKKGEKLGTITNLLGEELEAIESPFDGIVVVARVHCAVHSGDWLYSVGKIE